MTKRVKFWLLLLLGVSLFIPFFLFSIMLQIMMGAISFYGVLFSFSFLLSFFTLKADWEPPALLFKGLPHDMCQSPHQGYVFKGQIVLKYVDHEETIKAGEAYYMKPGHISIKGIKGSELPPLVDEFSLALMVVAQKSILDTTKQPQNERCTFCKIIKKVNTSTET